MNSADISKRLADRPANEPPQPPRARHILYVATEDWFFRSHFLPMARAAMAAGFRVTLAARLGDVAPSIAAEGIGLIDLALTRGSLNPIAALRETARVERLLRQERPDILHLIALKAILIGNLAAFFTDVPAIINSITGIGLFGIGGSGKMALARRLVWPVLTTLLGRANSWILVDNAEDARTLGRHSRNRITQIGGAGVDPDHFAELPLPGGRAVTAAVVARMLWSKGIDTTVEAQRRLRQRGIALELTLAGPIDRDNPNALSQATLDTWNAQPGIRWIGPQADVRTVWRDADIAVLASRGGEGLPRALLEAAACGRPIVTTDVPGCREFVRDGEDGFVVPPDDPNALADALQKLALDGELRRRMGRAARARVLSGYTEQQVADTVVKLYSAASPWLSGMAGAAEIAILSSNGVGAVLRELGPAFERASGNKLAIRYDTAAILQKEIAAGAPFDLAILTGPVIDALAKQGKIVAGSRADLAKSGIGIAIRAGAPRPDIASTESFKRTLLAAKSIAYTTQGASGIYFAGLIERLGIADAVKAKAKLQSGGAVAELVARGDAELAVQQISEILPVAGAELLGPLPPELQSFTVFSSGIGSAAKAGDAARAFVKFLTAPKALPVIKAKGMVPG